MFDLDAYLARIGVSGRPTLADIQRAHVTSIPFENLDPRRGVPVSLTLEDLQRKLVDERRGGYCFEHNLLLKGALEALGADVQTLLARVRLGAEPGATRPRSHLLLRVELDGGSWHSDAGFGIGTPREPLPFGPGAEQRQAGWRFRVVQEREQLVLQSAEAEGWTDMYAFLPEPVPFVDIETSNWFTSTHPRSPFVAGLSVGIQESDGTRVSLSDWSGLALSEHTPQARNVTPVAFADVPRLLAERFGLAGFALDADERLVPAAGGSP